MPLFSRCHYLQEWSLVTQYQLALCSRAWPALVMWQLVPAVVIHWTSGRQSVLLCSRIADHRFLTNFRTALLPPSPRSQTFPDKPKMWLRSLYQRLLPSLGPPGLVLIWGAQAWRIDYWPKLHCLDESLGWKFLEAQNMYKAKAESSCD